MNSFEIARGHLVEAQIASHVTLKGNGKQHKQAHQELTQQQRENAPDAVKKTFGRFPQRST